MPSFTWTGYFREGQWKAFRRFILEERRDAAKRVLAIKSEIDRIGRIRIIYAPDGNGTRITEQRVGLQVDAGSSLEKLLSAYVAMGGNPYDISMFLTPEDAIPLNDVEALPSQPGGGVATSVGMSYSLAAGLTSSDTNLTKYKPSRAGGPRHLPEAQVGGLVSRSRQWVLQEIQFKRNALEARIIKLCDLREQLLQEVEDIAWAVAGEDVPEALFTTDRYDESQTVAGIVYKFDSIFRIASEDGRVSAESLPNDSSLAVYPNLLSDDPESEGDNAL